VHFDCWNTILAEHGLSVDWDTYCQRWIGVSDRSMIAMICEGSGVAPELIWKEYARKRELFRMRMAECSPVTDEVRALLDELSGLKLAVVSSSNRTEVEPILETGGLLVKMDTCVYGNDVKNLKPAPDPYLLAVERLGVRRALVVEDSDAGVASGQAAGLDVLRVPDAVSMARLVRERVFGA
jgi:HAD superfamily hydrolase (TIGR01509 family)